MSVATGKFVDNTGSSCLNLESFVSSVPTIEELFSTMMENSAAARLSNVITTMLQSVNTEGDDAHDLSDCVVRGNFQEEGLIPVTSNHQLDHHCACDFPAQQDLQPESDGMDKSNLDMCTSEECLDTAVSKDKFVVYTNCYVVLHDIGPYLKYGKQCVQNIQHRFDKAQADKLAVLPTKKKQENVKSRLTAIDKRKRTSATQLKQDEDHSAAKAKSKKRKRSVEDTTTNRALGGSGKKHKKRKLISEYEDEGVGTMSSESDRQGEVKTPLSYESDCNDTVAPQSDSDVCLDLEVPEVELFIMSKPKSSDPLVPRSSMVKLPSMLAESLASKLARVKGKLLAPTKTIKKYKKKLPIRQRVEKYYYRPGQTNWHQPKPFV